LKHGTSNHLLQTPNIQTRNAFLIRDYLTQLLNHSKNWTKSFGTSSTHLNVFKTETLQEKTSVTRLVVNTPIRN